MTKPKWPGKYVPFRAKVKANARLILTGTLLAIDPASGATSMPGYALFIGGMLKERGTIKIEGAKTPQSRLAELYECVRAEFPNVDVMVVEELRGRMVSPTLHWATGVLVAAVAAQVLIEVPIPFWKALAKVTPHYFKSDDLDANVIGDVVVRLAKEVA